MDTLTKIKSYLFPAQKVLDKAAQQGGNSSKTTVTPSTDTSYLQNIVKQRMAEKSNPLINQMPKKVAPKKK